MVKHRILLADDSITIQKVVNLTFADEGIEVVAVGDGDAAMQKFVEAVPDLVMVDVNMPGVDGYHICEMIKQDEETQHIPVILLVGSFEPFDEAEARRVGADDFLTKPFQSIRQLVNKVSDLLNGKTGGLNDDKIAGSFDDTLEMFPPSEVKTADFGDATMDDEMIQTDQIGSLPVNEMQKLQIVPESNDSTESRDADFDFEAEIEEPGEDWSEENVAEIELPVENQPAVDVESAQIGQIGESLPRHENIYDFADQQEIESAQEENAVEEILTENVEAEETAFAFPETAANESAPESEVRESSVEENVVEQTPLVQPSKNGASKKVETTQEFELDDFDLLDLSQSRRPKSQKTVSSDVAPNGNLSPEDIEAVADKVVEKISDQVIKRIVREVFSQMTKKK